jgi:hypothetical protein
MECVVSWSGTGTDVEHAAARGNATGKYLATGLRTASYRAAMSAAFSA